MTPSALTASGDSVDRGSVRLLPSFQQRGLWLVDQLQGSSAEYNLLDALSLHGPLNVEHLENAVNAIVERHDNLRTRFTEADGELVPVVPLKDRILLGLADLTNLEKSHAQVAVDELLRKERMTSFDLARGPLIRVMLLRLSPNEHILVRTVHHIAYDGWSHGIFNQELETLYNAFQQKSAPALPSVEGRYADYAQSQHQWCHKEDFQDRIEYWRQQLSGAPPTSFTEIRSGSDNQGRIGAAHKASLPTDLTKALRDLGRAHNSTLFMTTLAAFSAFATGLTGSDDIVVGVPVRSRPRELENVIGFFANALPIRVHANHQLAFSKLLANVRRTTLDAQAHEVPFSALVERLHPRRTPRNSPFFNILFGLLTSPRVVPVLQGLDVKLLADSTFRTRYDLEVQVLDEGTHVGFTWRYNTGLFEHAQIVELTQQFELLLGAICINPELTVSELYHKQTEEKSPIPEEWLGTSTQERAQNLVNRIELQAARTPDALAVVFGDERLTYRELNGRANQVAHLLKRQGIHQGDRVTLGIPRSLDAIMSVIGILKAGATYVPVDVSHPIQRSLQIIADAKPAVILATDEFRGLLPDDKRCVCLNRTEGWSLSGQSVENPELARLPSMAAYVMYTSGSSGTPKGVVVEHGALSEFAAALGPELGFTSDDRHLAVTTLSFDISIVETLLPLCHGSMVIVAREDEVREPGRLLELLKQHQVTSMQATPSHWRLLLEAGCTSLQGLKMFVGGEPLSRDLAQALLNTGCARLVNLYGPTEATVWASKHVVTAKDVLPAAPDTVTIGRPLPNYRFYVLNENLDPVPAGVPGDLHIGGLALARGYLGQPELTAERFIADPYSGPGGRMYRTGDRACWRPDGLVDFLGREDQQVKIRGHRVELGEIESLLRKRPGVKDAIVVLRSANQHKRLVGYVISELAENHACQPESTTFGSELREHLRSILPDYMIPVAIVTLPFWPLTPNGKLDRKELPPPPNLDRPAPQEQMTAEEEALCRVFTKALRQNAVTVEDNFFDLGGDSLAAVRVVVAIKADLGVTVIVRDVFESESIRALAEKCARQRGKCEE